MPIFDIPVSGFIRVQNDSRRGAVQEVTALVARINSLTGNAGVARVVVSARV